jgi:hypothetical protein
VLKLVNFAMVHFLQICVLIPVLFKLFQLIGYVWVAHIHAKKVKNTNVFGAMNFHDAQETCQEFSVGGQWTSLCSLVNIVRDNDGARNGARSNFCQANKNHVVTSDECHRSDGHMVYNWKRDTYECLRDKNCRQVVCCATFSLE